MKDIEGWFREFYPISASECTKESAVNHSLRKFRGYLSENLRKYHVNLDDIKEEFSVRYQGVCDDEWMARSCALCILYEEDHNCSQCPLRISYCEKHSPCCLLRGTPWEIFLSDDDPTPMIKALRKAKEYEQRKVKHEATS